jgi:hypothetical protein
MRTRTTANNADSFIPDKDINEELDDGRIIQVAVKGVPIPRAEAIRLGLVEPVTAAEEGLVPSDDAKGGPEPSANKAARASKNK